MKSTLSGPQQDNLRITLQWEDEKGGEGSLG